MHVIGGASGLSRLVALMVLGFGRVRTLPASVRPDAAAGAQAGAGCPLATLPPAAATKYCEWRY